MTDFQSLLQPCQFLLQETPQAEECRNYLNSRLSYEMQKLFAFGYFPSIEFLTLLSSLVGEEILKKLGLLYGWRIYDSSSTRNANFNFFERHPLIMPYRDIYGNVIALIGRTLLSEKDRKNLGIEKYRNTSFLKGNHLFGLFEAKSYILSEGFVYVVEGQFDVIKAFEKGIYNIVAVGNSTLTSYQFSLLARYTNKIVLLFDNDDAGEQGRKSVAKRLDTIEHGVKINYNQYLPKGYKDLDEYLRHHDSISLLDKTNVSV
jgi:DNA primase